MLKLNVSVFPSPHLSFRSSRLCGSLRTIMTSLLLYSSAVDVKPSERKGERARAKPIVSPLSSLSSLLISSSQLQDVSISLFYHCRCRLCRCLPFCKGLACFSPSRPSSATAPEELSCSFLLSTSAHKHTHTNAHKI